MTEKIITSSKMLFSFLVLTALGQIIILFVSPSSQLFIAWIIGFVMGCMLYVTFYSFLQNHFFVRKQVDFKSFILSVFALSCLSLWPLALDNLVEIDIFEINLLFLTNTYTSMILLELIKRMRSSR